MEDLQYISCVRFSVQLFIAESVFLLGWRRRSRFGLRLFLAAAGYFGLAGLLVLVCTRVPGYVPVLYMVYYTCLFAMTLGVMAVCFQTSLKEMLFAGVCGYAVQHIAFGCYSILVEVTDVELGPVLDLLLLRILPYVLAAAAVYFGMVRRTEGMRELKERDVRMLGLAFVILLTTIFISVLVDSRMFQNESGLLRNVICKIYGILCSALAIFVAFHLSRENRILRENEMMEQMLHSLKEQQRLSRENINIINIKCHDLKYRISKIARIEDERDQEEYIESIKNAISIYDKIYHTGNDALDLVLTEKSLLCEEYHIKLSCMADGVLLGFMNTTDVYALFGNLLDNAIESVMKEEDEEKRIISMQISRRNGTCHIHMDNYCGEPVRFEDGLPMTTKPDKQYHGFGVRSIRYIADKYEGDLLMRAEENQFRVDIVFYAQPG